MISVLRLTPHQRAVSSVNDRDGWAREDDTGFIIADLNGGTCPITDRSLRDLKACQRLRKLTAYKTGITDEGLKHLTIHQDLRILHLDDSAGITDYAIPHLAKLQQLEELSLGGTAISARGLQELRLALPNCAIKPSLLVSSSAPPAIGAQ